MKIIIYGYYNNNNLGDELFKLSFTKLFSKHELVFTNKLDEHNNIDLLIIGDSSIFTIIFDAQTGMEIQIGGTY